MKKIYFNLAFIILLLIACLAIASPVMPDFTVFGKNIGQTLRDTKIKLGLDLKGGAHLVYEADMSQIPEENQKDSLSGARDVIERRVNAYGISEPQIVTNKTGDQYRIIVDLAGIDDISAAIKMIGQTPILDFREEKTQEDLALSPDEQKKVQEQNQKIKEQAQNILQKALQAEDFSFLAKEFSQDPGSKEKGGDLDFVKKGDLIPEFKQVIFNQDFPKDTVWPELVKSSIGFHIIKKTDQRGEGDDQEIRASHILFFTQDENAQPVTNQDQLFKITALTGKNLDNAQVIFDQNTQEPQVALQFDTEGTRLFREITQRNVGKRVAIYLDGQPVTIPTVQSVIPDGRAVITGSQNVQEANELAKRLNAGALPVPIELVSQEKVGASLGGVSLQKSLKAGLLGLCVVSGFMLVFYLSFGLVAVFALISYSVIMVAIFKILGITLTLSGIAGFILSLGMAVDANILIFERVKEELKQGQNSSQALQNGFKRAWNSIRDGNVSTLITCFILAGLGTGMVKGFAITLGIGVALSMFSAVFITRNILQVLDRFLSKFLIIGFNKKLRK
ncbi:MAG: protein translocase subunit SecD [Patescibacteria group bacterium]|nr:protein translocase subunit SecD [Patescibacteria group bacterium]